MLQKLQRTGSRSSSRWIRPTTAGDPVPVRQLLTNLVQNAIRHNTGGERAPAPSAPAPSGPHGGATARCRQQRARARTGHRAKPHRTVLPGGRAAPPPRAARDTGWACRSSRPSSDRHRGTLGLGSTGRRGGSAGDRRCSPARKRSRRVAGWLAQAFGRFGLFGYMYILISAPLRSFST